MKQALIAITLLASAAGLAFGVHQPVHAATPQDSAMAAEIVERLNMRRSSGCEGRGAERSSSPLRRDTRLDRAAALMLDGDSLADAMKRARYRADQSVQIALTGHRSAEGVAQTIAAKRCASLVGPAIRDIGVQVRGRQTMVVLAAPFQPEVEDPAAVRREVLARTNQARAQGQRCGDRTFAPTPALQPDHRLDEAARLHALDMARQGYFSHRGADGRQPADRIADAGYRWRSAGENIAAGQSTAQAAVDGWIRSPGHCANLMSPNFRAMGIGFAVNPDSPSGIYWVQTFGAPR